MGILQLDCDELDIECQIRNIVGTISNRITLLTEAVGKENTGEAESPTEPHAIAARYPKREVEACAKKLKKHHESMEDFMQACDSMDADKLEELATRVEHISGRLSRIAKTKTGPAVISAQKLLESCDKLIGCFNDLREKRTSIPEVEKSLKELVIVVPDSGEEDEHPVDHSQPVNESTSKVFANLSGHDNPPPQLAVASFENNNLNQQQIDSIVNALMTKLNLPLTNTNKPSNELLIENMQIRPRMQSSTIISPTHFQTSPKFNAAIPPPNYNVVPDGTGGYVPTSAAVQQKTSGTETSLKRNGRLEIHRWAISFSGECGEIPVERFIYRVESMANSNGITTEFLVKNLNVLLNGKAREWYWMFVERKRNVNWEELKCAMIHRFQDRRTDADIRQALERRRQRARESFLDFYNEILSMSLPLQNPMTEMETINLLIRNMRPGLQSNFAGQMFTDISTLVNRSIAVEDTWNRIGWIPELAFQSRRQINELQGNADYCEMESNQVNLAEPSDNYDSVCAVSWSNSTYNINETPKRHACWNCGNNSHFFKDCTMPISHKFCFGCGAKNVIKINCQICRNVNTSGNHQRGVRNFAALRSQNRVVNQPKPDMVDSAANTDPEFYKILQRKHD